MIRSIALLACTLFLVACSTTSTVYQPRTPTAGQTYTYAFSNEGGDDLQGIAELDRVIQQRLLAAGLWDRGEAEQKVEVVLKHFYLRSDGARFWAGIMAGRDKIISRVRMVAADGTQTGSFEVETTNTTAWGTSDGLMERHADEIVAQLR